ncbi:MAG: hypothetical protein ABSH35_25160 [Isosphaeraceae bacterium]|jgi:hypothetical protein
MGSERRSMPEQELSIRQRDQELFVEPQETPAAEPPVKPFPIYLRETPANPMATEVKVILWIVGIAVLLLFGVALWRAQRPSRLRRTSSATKAAVMDVAPLLPTHRRWKGQPARLAQGFGAEPGVISGGAADRASDS